MALEAVPEIQTATAALEQLIAQTETEIEKMKEIIDGKKDLARSCRKAVAAVNPKGARPKKKAPAKEARSSATV